MPRNREFGRLITALTKGRTLRDVAAAVGISHSSITLWRDGAIPKPSSLAKFCAGLDLDAETRAGLFAAAGLVDPARNLPRVFLSGSLPDELRDAVLDQVLEITTKAVENAVRKIEGTTVLWLGLKALAAEFPDGRVPLHYFESEHLILTSDQAGTIIREIRELLEGQWQAAAG